MPDYQALRQRLEQKRQEILQRLNEIQETWHRPVDVDLEEQSLELENEDVLTELDREGMEELNQIDRALERMDNGTYGVCRLCGATISEERLEALPYTDVCKVCAADAEKLGE